MNVRDRCSVRIVRPQGVTGKKVQWNGSRHIYRLPINLACEHCTFSGAPAHHRLVAHGVSAVLACHHRLPFGATLP